ncbi:RAxF-45 family protein [Cytobacillus dafuensis]|nr:RAxF-45 family protein [Cytobacillus dafuensis]
MSQAVLMRGFWMEFIYIYRAIFAGFAVNGISMPFFSNFIAKIKQ